MIKNKDFLYYILLEQRSEVNNKIGDTSTDKL